MEVELRVGRTVRVRHADPAGDPEVRQEELDRPDELRRRRGEGDLRTARAPRGPDGPIGRIESLEVGDLQVVGHVVDLGWNVAPGTGHRRGDAQPVAILEHPHEGGRVGGDADRPAGLDRHPGSRVGRHRGGRRAVLGTARAGRSEQPALDAGDQLLALARLGQQEVELFGHRLGGGQLGRPEGERRDVAVEHAVGAHPAQDLPAPDVLDGRVEADRVARLADLDPVDLRGQLVDPLPAALVGQEPVVAGGPDLAAVAEGHAEHVALADQGHDRGPVGGHPAMVGLRQQVGGHEDGLAALLGAVQVLDRAQPVGRADPGLRREAGRVVEEHVLGARVAGVDPVGVGARVPVVDRGVVLDARVAAQVGGVGHAAEDVGRLVGAHRLAVDDRVGRPVGAVDDRAA